MRNFVKSALFSALLLLTLTGTEIKAGPIVGALGGGLVAVTGKLWGIFVAPKHYQNPTSLAIDYGLTTSMVTSSPLATHAVVSLTPIAVKEAVERPENYQSWVNGVAGVVFGIGFLLPLP